MKIQDVAIKDICRDESIQPRTHIDHDLAAEYYELQKAGVDIGLPILYFDGKKYYPGDGNHRIEGWALADKKMVRAEVRKGTRRDAILHACGANTQHGRRRSGEDKRKAVKILLEEIKDEPPKDWPNTRIADICKVAESFVRKVKAELRGDRELQDVPDENSHGARTMEVENNGENIDSSSIRDRLTPAQRVVYDKMTPEEREERFEQSKTDTLDGRLAAAEVIAFRVQKRLGEDAFGKSIRDGLKRFLASMRDAVGWEDVKQTVRDEAFRDRTLTDFERLRKLNLGTPGERQRVPILDQLTANVKEDP
jgi:hypothetical protein